MKKLTFLIALLISVNTFAQWTTDTFVNTLVADSESGDMKTIGTSEGETYIVFWKTVAAPVNYELRLQKLDIAGNQQFGPDGMLISNTIPMSTYTVIWSLTIDSENNIYVGVTGTDDSSGRLFKVDTEGNLLWSGDGISITGIAYNVTVLPLENGDIIASWIPGNKAFIQKFDSDGNTIWDNPIEIISGTSKTAPGNFYEMSDGGFIAVFHTYNYGISSTLYAQKYDTDGVALWASPTQLSNTTTAYNATYSGTQDGDNVYLGYKGAHDNRFDSYLQRINPDGTLPWGINGMDFDVNETNFEMNTKIAFSPGSQYVYSICSYTNTNQSIYGEYIQKFDKETGAREFSDNAKMIYELSSESKVHASNLYLVEDQPFFLLKTGEDNGASPTTLSVLLLDGNGEFAWPEEVMPIASYQANKSRTALTKTVNGQSVALFIEDKSDGMKIYAQNFIQEMDLPAQPLLTSPEDGMVDLPLENSFSWQTALNAETYTIQISEDNAFSNIAIEESDIANTNIDITLLENSTTYFWRVIASNSSGDSEWSEVWSFTTQIAIPAQPLLTSPADGTVDLPLENSFSWETALNAETYTIQISEDNYFSNITFEESDIAYTTIDITLLEDNTTYFWRVMASNSTGDSEWSEAWSLTTKLETGLENYTLKDMIQVYPNPAKDRVTISSSLAVDQVQLFNQVGQLVKTTATFSSALTIDVSDLSRGVYFIKIFSNEDAVTKKFVIE